MTRSTSGDNQALTLGREVRGAQEDIDFLEVLAPGGTRGHAPVLLLDDLGQRRELLAGFMEGEEQADVEPE
jgi:hypothetical protein